MELHKSAQELGFTLLEMMVALVIIAILAVIGIPSYLSYMQKSQFSEVIQAASALKTTVSICATTQKTLTGCSNGMNGIPPAISAIGYIASITITDGIITATSQNIARAEGRDIPTALVSHIISDAQAFSFPPSHSGGSHYTYILTPDLDDTTYTITWTTGGTCVNKGLC